MHRCEKLNPGDACPYMPYMQEVGSNSCLYTCNYCNKEFTLNKRYVYCAYKFEKQLEEIKNTLKKEFDNQSLI